MPHTKFEIPEKYRYFTGFNAYIESEAIEGANPVAHNTPQCPPYGLYTERISGGPFISARSQSCQTWQYRILPSAVHQPFEEEREHDIGNGRIDQKLTYTPTQLRWSPFDVKDGADWITAMQLLGACGDPATRSGLAYFIFSAGRSMHPTISYSSSDGDLLLILQEGVLDIKTELGSLLVRPKEICVIPRGVRYQVMLTHGSVRGYAVELFQGHFTLPELGPLGSFGLANARDFQIPCAAFDQDISHPHKLITKFKGKLFSATQSHTPFDVVAWQGTYYPYKYDLGRFMVFGSLSYDHPDPSIFTLLSSSEGVIEMAIFPPRWLSTENTMRPPWYHRNTMCEFMGLIEGVYDGRSDGGFQPGGASLHTVMCAHGPDTSTHERSSIATLEPEKVGESSMAFVLETPFLLGLTEWAMKTSEKRQDNYNEQTWLALAPHTSLPTSLRTISALLDPPRAGAKH